MIALKTTLFFILVPGFLLGIVSLLVIPHIASPAVSAGFWNWLAVPFWLTGVAVMLWYTRDFVVHRRGTPALIDRPKKQAINGL